MIFASVLGGAGRCQGECGHYFGGAFLLGTWRCETFLSQSRHSWEPINPNDPTATLQTQAPLYGPDICPNGQNLNTQLFWWVKKDAWIFLCWFSCCRIWRFFVSDKWRQSNHQSIECWIGLITNLGFPEISLDPLGMEWRNMEMLLVKKLDTSILKNDALIKGSTTAWKVY